ncbi:MAG: hypothetical protein IPG06_13875 [Haliea sp.]|nr:hypothetical protein [Haliea sp.]
MQRKGRKYEVVAAAAKASREPRGVQRDGQRDVQLGVQRGATPMIEVSDADYRTVHLPCDALEERAQPIKKGGRKPGN